MLTVFAALATEGDRTRTIRMAVSVRGAYSTIHTHLARTSGHVQLTVSASVSKAAQALVGQRVALVQGKARAAVHARIRTEEASISLLAVRASDVSRTVALNSGCRVERGRRAKASIAVLRQPLACEVRVE